MKWTYVKFPFYATVVYVNVVIKIASIQTCFRWNTLIYIDSIRLEVVPWNPVILTFYIIINHSVKPTHTPASKIINMWSFENPTSKQRTIPSPTRPDYTTDGYDVTHAVAKIKDPTTCGRHLDPQAP